MSRDDGGATAPARLVLGAPAWVWAAALLPRLAVWACAWTDPQRVLRPDSYDYLRLAENMLRRGAFSLQAAPPWTPDAFRTPGYPLLLLPLKLVEDPPLLALGLVQCLLGAWTAALAWRWTRSWAGPRGAALAALVLALDPVAVFHAPLALTETPHLLLVTAAAALAWSSLRDPRPSVAAASGLLWSLAALTRPISIYLPLLLAAFWRRERKVLAAFLAAAYLLPGLWVARNLGATGRLEFSSIGGHDLLKYSASAVEALRTGVPWREAAERLELEAARDHGPFRNFSDRSAAYGKKALKVLLSHPLLFARHLAWGAAKVLGGTGWELLLEWTGVPADPEGGTFKAGGTGSGTLRLLKAHPWLVPLQVLYLAGLAALYLAAAAGLLALWRSGRREEAAFLLAATLYYLGLSSLQGYYRFRIPLLPFLAAAAALRLHTVSSTSAIE